MRAIGSPVVVFALLCSACSTSAVVGASSLIHVPKDSATTCANFCADMGMTLGQVVVVANSVGCVCNVSRATASEANGGAAVAAAVGAMAADQQPPTPTPMVNVPIPTAHVH
jgi:hypothetical protein